MHPIRERLAHGRIKIETYWNVNTQPLTACLTFRTIKIETYWNVNSPTPYSQGG